MMTTFRRTVDRPILAWASVAAGIALVSALLAAGLLGCSHAGAV